MSESSRTGSPSVIRKVMEMSLGVRFTSVSTTTLM